MHVAKFPCSLLVLLLLFVTEVLADDDDTDFLMNVFSDLGPVLALFGEQFARQFLSETFTWYDHVIFACVPLGIMTAIAGAIRVEGRPVLKAFIGRARENKAAAEIEYMSSTSAEVGELFNGRGIVRTMGQSNIAQFILFQRGFDSNKTTYGIHTLQSAAEEGQDILKKEDYRDELDVRFMKWLKRFKAHPTSPENALEHGANNERTSNNYWDSLQYPNLQLNIATKGITAEQRSAELHLAAFSAVILQMSLLAIAAVIPYQFPGFEQQPWGLPCYIGGSVLLFTGMLACSVAIERSTKEYKWYPNESKEQGEKLSLFWVQGKQRVSDQEFASYIIYAQDKEFMSTSSRKEDVGSKSHERDDQNEDSYEKQPSIRTQESFVQAKKIQTSKGGGALVWKRDIRAVTALFAGGAGFTIQFIGLRGLPWPVAVAHLGALITMAIIRALVRRRLGEDTQYREVQSEHELDYLAIELVENDGCILPHPEKNTKPLPEVLQLVLSWRVDTAEHPNGTIHSFDFPGVLKADDVCSEQNNHNVISDNSTAQQRASPIPPETVADKLISVRKRLGDLCEWETMAFKPALTLVHSIEHFLDEFASDELSSNRPITWGIPMKSLGDKSGIVKLEITKTTTGWKVNAGKVEAILSIWMAHLEAQNTTKGKKNKATEWQRSKADVALGVDYCRILGRSNDNRVLQRDLNWWVGSSAITEIEADTQVSQVRPNTQPEGSRTTSFQTQGSAAARRFTSHVSSSEQTTSASKPHIYKSKHKDAKIVIGYTAPADANGPQTLHVQHSTAATATIVMQHLFTNFIWTIVDHLPKNFLGQGAVNIGESVSVSSPIKSGIDRNLEHEKLTKFARRAENEGLGTYDDILFCLIPVFSIKDRLPNDATLEPDLPKFTERKHWPKAAASFSEILKSMPKTPRDRFEDSLTLTAVARALDYVYLMALDEQFSQLKKPANANTESKQPEIDESEDSREKTEVSRRNSKLAKERSAEHLQTLISNVFPGVMMKLWLFYEHQGRANFFLDLKRKCQERIAEHEWQLQLEIQQGFMEHIRFTNLHQEIVNNRRLNLGEWQGMEFQTRDIFGWTALHYAAACRDLEITECNNADKVARLGGETPKNWWLDNFGRSPIHIASSTGNSIFLDTFLTNMSKKDVRSALQSSGLDGMTPVHLAIAGGHKECLDILIRFIISFGLELKEDAWRRSPVHLAIALAQYPCCTALLESGDLKFKPSTVDVLDKSSLSYLDENVDEEKEIGHLLIRNYSEKFSVTDKEGKTVWHHAVRFLGDQWLVLLEDNLLDILEARHKHSIDMNDNNQETGLHLAIRYKNNELVASLLSLGANLSTNKDKHQSPLMLACSLNQLAIVKTILRSDSGTVKDKDGEGKLALHYAVNFEECDSGVRHEIISTVIDTMRSVGIEGIDVKDENGLTPLYIAIMRVNSSVVSILLDSGADPTTTDTYGCNALHLALTSWPDGGESVKAMPNIVRNVLAKAPGCMDASTYMGHTLLTLACYSGEPLEFISEAVDLSRQKGSKINLNYPDHDYGKSPLAWACEGNQKNVVEILLQSTTVDLNQKSNSRRNSYAPLHFALEEKNREIIKMLVSSPERHADIYTTIHGYTDALEFACWNSNEDCIESLLLHPEARSPKFLVSAWKWAVQQPSLIEEMPWFVEEWEDAILNPTNKVPFPIHELAEVGRLKTFQLLFQADRLHHEFDDNGWMPAEVATRYGHHELALFLRENEPQRDISPNRYAQPSNFISLFNGPEFSSSMCSSHDPCSHQMLDIKFPKNDQVDWQYCYLRTKEAIPPNARSFYFEVEILHPLQMKICAIGFCQSNVPENHLPGWHKGSFAYHGDDGKLFENGGPSHPQEADKTFGEGDVVGCGLDFNTGTVYRTRNGVLLDTTYSVEDPEFLLGRFYPCVGARTNGEGGELQVQVTLPSSSKHSFTYKEQYDTAWDDRNPSVSSPNQSNDAVSEGMIKDE
ncbi:hypothetical protein FPSE_00694 [Fusarium pseudograminearum CS3096]|uniref:B30.2/SPRY domain-containing protein n=1 Tax=Fusarium pseudograminearum (strain CS3096) TaxID=1028729 RepID=K3VW37_FUSPC|nr:hypothetical protein FPSE_00694 [Fusarium pseudograminearum CS3096]EKJ79093.1 hypothetical protein FPSE_00694 [Fusarium pseudograminearum CS3096]